MELPAPAHVLVRPDAVRQRVRTRIHKDLHADSDANNLVSPNPAAPDYIGKHPGNAFMELQFYGPGYVPQFEGFGCAAHQYFSTAAHLRRHFARATSTTPTAYRRAFTLRR